MSATLGTKHKRTFPLLRNWPDRLGRRLPECRANPDLRIPARRADLLDPRNHKTRTMKKHLSSFTVAIISCTAVLLAQSLPTALPSKPEKSGVASVHRPEYARRVFTLQGKHYVSSLTLQQAQSAPTWEPSLPIPISLEDAENVARSELKKVTDDEIRWRFSEFSIARLTGTNSYFWYFAVTLKPIMESGTESSDSFTMLMNAKGEPGRIGHVGPNTDNTRPGK
jgi:hypothetical protein